MTPKPTRALNRRSAFRRACLTSGVPRYAADFALVRGRCQHGRCKGRWAVVRVTLDFRAERVERYAATECTSCGRTWRRVRVPRLRSDAGYQSVRLTLILRGHVRRWRTRGTWHREGSDAVIVREADLGDVDEAVRVHDKRAARLADLRAARKAKREAEALATHAETMAWIARLDARDAEREAEEAAARAREA